MATPEEIAVGDRAHDEKLMAHSIEANYILGGALMGTMILSGLIGMSIGGGLGYVFNRVYTKLKG